MLALAVLAWGLLAAAAWGQTPSLGWETRHERGLRVEFVARDRAYVNLLLPALVEDRKLVTERLRMFPDTILRIVVAPDKGVFREMAPGVPESGTLGVYLLGQGLIVVHPPRSVRPGNWDPRGVLRHELTHAVIDLAVSRTRAPVAARGAGHPGVQGAGIPGRDPAHPGRGHRTPEIPSRC